MARRFTGSRPMVRGPKRLTQWGQGPGGAASTSFASSTASLLGSGIAFGASGTVVRIRGHFSAFLESFTSAGDGFHGAVGIGLVSAAAFAAGIASVPTPITESAWDGWLWHNFFDCFGALAAGSTNVGVHGNSGVSIDIDTKAMRKVSDEMTIFAAAEVAESGTAIMNAHLDSRLLLKLG